MTASSKSPTYAPHKIHNSLTWLNGDRAVTIMMATIQNRRTIKDVACELSTDTQLLFSTQKIDGQWYIVRFESIYEQDRLIPVLPDATLSMDSAALAKIPPKLCLYVLLHGAVRHRSKSGTGRQRSPGNCREDIH